MTESNVFTRGAVLRAGGAGLVAAALGLDGLGVELREATDADAGNLARRRLRMPAAWSRRRARTTSTSSPIRNDVREAKAGLPLRSRSPRQRVDVQAHPKRGRRHLALRRARGLLRRQGTSTSSCAACSSPTRRASPRFDDDLPGLVPGPRDAHPHEGAHRRQRPRARTYTGGHVSHTGQMFFSDAITDTVAKRAPYSARTITRTRNAEDRVYTEQGGSKAVLSSRSSRRVCRPRATRARSSSGSIRPNMLAAAG